jgi:hypothetical protein
VRTDRLAQIGRGDRSGGDNEEPTRHGFSLFRLHPHDLSDRYASVKIDEGVPVTRVAAQLGHSKTSLTFDTYSHVLLEDSAAG